MAEAESAIEKGEKLVLQFFSLCMAGFHLLTFTVCASHPFMESLYCLPLL